MRCARSFVVPTTLVAVISVIGLVAEVSGEPFQQPATQGCSSAGPCISAQNTGTGSGIAGGAQHSSGIVGQTSAASNGASQMRINAGVRGEDRSRARKGKTDYSGGVLGTSQSGFGVWGFSQIQAGVIGETFNPSGKDQYAAGGVEGVDASTDGGQSNAGVLGISSLSNGVQGITKNPSNTSQFGRAAIFGIDESNDGGRRNWGSAGFSSTGTGILGISLAVPQTNGAAFASALLGICENGGPSIEAADGPLPSANLFLLADCSGNLTISGTLMSGQPPLIVTHSTQGDVTAYAPREAEPTIEDFGHGKLVDGFAHVALNADFAATVEHNDDYLVFLTPEGDSRGLFVTGKSPAGFEVRESQHGTSAIAFSYRVVGKPIGDHARRLPKAHSVVAQDVQTHHTSSVDLERQYGVVPAVRSSMDFAGTL